MLLILISFYHEICELVLAGSLFWILDKFNILLNDILPVVSLLWRHFVEELSSWHDTS
jgi:hypothetical protein